LVDDLLAAKEICKLNDVVDVVTVFDVVGLVYHADVVKDVVLADHELEENDANWPDI
jgi:hypothetical protein